MLTNDILQATKGLHRGHAKRGESGVVQTGEHEKREELVKFLNDFATVSEKITVEERDQSDVLRSPVSFMLEVDGEPNGIIFSGVPGGHEFNSFVLAVLHSSGTALKLDDSIVNLIKGVQQPLKFESFISLSCHNCPDVVQALNQFATLNTNISNEMIDGGLFQDVIDERNIQGVPTVYLNGELFANGKIDTAQLISKLTEQYPEVVESAVSDEPALPLQDVTIIGGGPAGVAAAIYSARKGLNVTLIGEVMGGQVKDTMGIENLISVSKTTGPELTGAMVNHMNDYDITVKEHFKVEKVEKGTVKTVFLSSGERIETKTLIIATGAKWRELGVPGERENIGNGVAYCPHCDGPFFKGKDVAVIGGGNSGIEAALDLAGIVKSVTVFEFMPNLKADQVLIDQANNRENINILTNVATQEILAGNGKVNAIRYQDRETDVVKDLELAGVFVQIGLIPNSSFLQDVVELTPYGEVVINEKGETSEPGIYACGDVTTVPYKQIIIAMGEGSKASLAAYDYLLMNQ